ncbi:hypothetical protein SD66_08925 [Enterobacter cloacae]|nr:hypothetical protein SD66_08925 [Enterobacter cloacae]
MHKVPGADFSAPAQPTIIQASVGADNKKDAGASICRLVHFREANPDTRFCWCPYTLQDQNGRSKAFLQGKTLANIILNIFLNA